MDKGARSIFDKDIYDYVKNTSKDFWVADHGQICWSNITKFKHLYINSIKDFRYSKLKGIENFDNTIITDGVTGAFLDWYVEYGLENIYVLKGEYPFHKNNGCRVVESIEEIPNNKTLILSLPFSATGNIHEQFQTIVGICEEKNINILLDCAYLNISKIGEVSIESPAIKSFATSLSKVYNTGMTKIGLKFNREKQNTPYQQLNDWHYVNHFSINLHTHLLQKFGLSFMYDRYNIIQIETSKKLDLTPSNTIIFALTYDQTYDCYNRDSIINRVCISKEIQDEYCSQ